MTRLIYESLTGADSEKYRLHTTMQAYKRIETQHSLMDIPTQALEAFSGKPKPDVVVVDCGKISEQPLPMAQWLENDHKLITEEIEQAGRACHEKITAELPNLLSR